MYCGEQGRGGGDNVEAFRFPPGDAPLAARDCSRRVFCAGMLTGALASVMSLGGCAARRNEAEGSAVPAKQKANHPSAQKTEAVSRASTSLLQRRCKLGYARAARIMDEMEQKGIIGPYEGAKPRAVLISRQQWLEMQMNQPDE